MTDERAAQIERLARLGIEQQLPPGELMELTNAYRAYHLPCLECGEERQFHTQSSSCEGFRRMGGTST